eukprot:365580-Chlamydomonas_euryale.AAC.3
MAVYNRVNPVYAHMHACMHACSTQVATRDTPANKKILAKAGNLPQAKVKCGLLVMDGGGYRRRASKHEHEHGGPSAMLLHRRAARLICAESPQHLHPCPSAKAVLACSSKTSDTQGEDSFYYVTTLGVWTAQGGVCFAMPPFMPPDPPLR